MSRNALIRRSQQVPYLPVTEAVVFWGSIDSGAAHGWPGGTPQGRLIAGGFSFEGTDLIWDFLKDKSRVPEIDYL